MESETVLLTLRLALCTSAILLVVSLPLAYTLTFGQWRGKPLVEALIALPLVLPPTVLGYYLLVVLGPMSGLGQWLQSWMGRTLAFSFEGLLLASILFSLPFAVQPLVTAFHGVDRQAVRAAWTLGASPWQAFWRIIVPQSRAGLVTSAALAFAHTVGEFGVVLMVGGNIAGETRTLSIALYDQVQALDYAGANQTALMLLAVSVVVLALVYRMRPGPTVTI